MKLLDMLGSEGPQVSDSLSSRLPFPKAQVEAVLQELEMKNLVSIGFFTKLMRVNTFSALMNIELQVVVLKLLIIEHSKIIF